jgi:hypothetical protein
MTMDSIDYCIVDLYTKGQGMTRALFDFDRKQMYTSLQIIWWKLMYIF